MSTFYPLFASGEPESEASYVVWVDGATYYAKNGHTGAVTSNADAITILNSTRGVGHKIFLKSGNYTINSTLYLNDLNIEFCGEGMSTVLIAKNALNSDIISSIGGYVYLHDFMIEGNSANQASGHGIYTTDGGSGYAGAQAPVIERVKIVHVKQSGFNIHSLEAVLRNDVAVACGTGFELNYMGFGTMDSCFSAGNDLGIYLINSYRNSFSNNQIFGNTGTYGGLYAYASTSNTFKSNHIYSNTYSGVLLVLSSYNIFNGNTININGGSGMSVKGSNHNLINNNNINDNSQTTTGSSEDIYMATSGGIHSTYNIITENTFSSLLANKVDYHIYEDGAAQDYNIIEDNNFLPAGTAGTFFKSGVNDKVSGNIGYVTENSGTATITAAATSIAVTHGLSYTPSALDVSVVLTNLPTTPIGDIYVDTFTATQFTIHCTSVPGVATAIFAWHANKTP